MEGAVVTFNVALGMLSFLTGLFSGVALGAWAWQ